VDKEIYQKKKLQTFEKKYVTEQYVPTKSHTIWKILTPRRMKQPRTKKSQSEEPAKAFEFKNGISDIDSIGGVLFKRCRAGLANRIR
jgi:hypothetical protein